MSSPIPTGMIFDKKTGTFVKPTEPAVKKSWIKRNMTTLLLLLMGAVGLGLILYPSFADWWNSFHQSRAVASYMEAVANMDKSKYEEMLRDADAYNAKLSKTGIQWMLTEEQKKEYEKVLNINDTGIMGYIDIPKINVELPVYHGTDEAVLQIAVGHLEGTSLPVGGKGSHCVVSGHRGLPSARLFTDIDKLVEGDTFTLTVLNRTVTYEVDQIRIVEPHDLSDLQMDKSAGSVHWSPVHRTVSTPTGFWCEAIVWPTPRAMRRLSPMPCRSRASILLRLSRRRYLCC